MTLSSEQYEQLNNALVDAFPSRAKLARLVKFKFNRLLAAISDESDITQVVFTLIQTAEAEGWTRDLIGKAYEANPGNPHLHEIAEKVSIAPSMSGVSDAPELERMLTSMRSFLDPTALRERMGKTEPTICQVEVAASGNTIYGTGFLVGPDTLITNYHVVEAVIQGAAGKVDRKGRSAQPGDVVLRFDYRKLRDGTTLNGGKVCRLANDWLIDYSEDSYLDAVPPPKPDVPQPDQLDYALLRVAGRPGDEKLTGPGSDDDDPVRGFLKPEGNYDYSPDATLAIMQHPNREPLKVVQMPNGIIAVNANKTRILHRVDTLGGSSGSPCFDGDWKLIALHHSGDPNFAPDHKPTYNEAIPFTAIIKLLEDRGKRGALGA
ncbi:MAG TPA: effector-associated domain EAD1-containing protein [Chloroflexia bacterium]|nr:effector-associated domain EAD1-containing protein [Chloroflexia bacterium]